MCLLTRAIFGQRDYERAIAAARETLRVDPQHDWAYRMLSLCEQALGRPAESVAAAEKSVRLAPLIWQTNMRLAESLTIHGGRQLEAEAAVAAALELAPDNADVHLVAAKVARTGGRYEEAAESCHRSLAIRPEHPGALHELARLQLLMANEGSLASAGVLFAEGAGMNPGIDLFVRNLDFTIRIVLSRMAFLSGISGWILTEVARLRPSFTRIIAGVILLGLAAYGGRYLSEVSGAVRRRVWRLVCDQNTFLVPAAVHASAILLIVPAIIAPAAVTQGITTFAGVLGLAAAELYGWRARRQDLPRARRLSAKAARRALRVVALLAAITAGAAAAAQTGQPSFFADAWIAIWGWATLAAAGGVYRRFTNGKTPSDRPVTPV
jgi:hypothetical protein